jgi:hypothetical protein
VPFSQDRLAIGGCQFGIELELGEGFDDEDITLPKGWKSHGEHCGIEVVSPVLVGRRGIFQVREVLRRIWEAHESIEFDDCGMHVHIDIQDFTLGNIKNLLRMGVRFDEVIFSLMDPARYDNDYCKHLDYTDEQINHCKSIESLFDLQDNQRYYGINLLAFEKHGTVEFRYAMGTADWQVIYPLLSLYMRMVAAAKANLPIPHVNIKNWSSAGIKFNKDKTSGIYGAKETFFDFLEIRGGVRRTLDKLFEINHNHDNESRTFETRKKFPDSRKLKFQTGLRFS